ncbi:hypothetical protein BA065_02880 [Nanoarchaeota archaeon NZ13-N]|uniref:Uncharacterized protein n=1 Tax=Candidatus Nanoclepta minutus TaxID=1940235 RepID=A0A397WRC4_9ARCH|nr:MAG: hypothetical protein BA065_02880 [Nanoarchaeota archaeon NZ13-N]RIB35216.1 MAG: hypothetical protein BXU00_02710 [Candidatus Nanoclepta minutus]
MKEDIYKTKVSFKTKFNIGDFYEKFTKFLSSLGWNGVLGKDYFETYQYHRITPEGLEFYEIVFELTKTFQPEEPKVTWYMKIPIKITGYDRRTSFGTIEIEINGSHEIEEKEVEIRNTPEKILAFIGFSKDILKKNYEKTRVKGAKKRSISSLSKECEDIKKWLHEYFKAYY